MHVVSISVYAGLNLSQHVRDASHDGGNTLDHLLTPTDDAALLSRVAVHPTCFSDHYSVTCQLHQPLNVQPAVKHQFRDLRRIDILERRYRRTLAANDKANFHAAPAAARKAIAQSRSDAITKRIADVAGE